MRLPSIILAVACLVPTAVGAEIVTVLGGDQAPYRAAAEAARTALAAAGHRAETCLGPELEHRADLAGIKVVVAIGSEAAATAARTAPGAHLVFCLVTPAAAAALPPVASGVLAEVPADRQLALVAEALPSARRIAMLVRGDVGRRQSEALRAALPAGWALTPVPVEDHPSVAEAVDALMALRPDVVWTAADTGLYSEATVRSLLLSALRRRVPVFGYSPAFVRAGALVGVGIDPAGQGSQAARLAIAALSSAPPVREGAAKAEIAVNLVVAGKLLLDLPAALVARADHVVRP
jgi:putative ABC transport system substrate-binding protein